MRREARGQAGRVAEASEGVQPAAGKLTRAGLADPRTREALTAHSSPAMGSAAEGAGIEDWSASSFIAAMGVDGRDGSDPDLWDAGNDSTGQRFAASAGSGGRSPRQAAAMPAWASPRVPTHDPIRGSSSVPGTPGAPEPGPLDLTAQRQPRGPKPNAQMLVRALAADDGTLLDLWTGPAYFVGELPASYHGKRHRRAWTWTRDGRADDQAATLKIDSDARGKTGRTVAEWAPRETTTITVDFVPLTQPFGAQASPLPGEASPSGARAPFSMQEADGSAPISGDIAAAVDGPQRIGTFREHGALTALDEKNGSTIWLADGYVRIYGKPSEYLYRVAPQTSPRQRLVQITATYRVAIDAHGGRGAVELAHQLRRVQPSELDAIRMASTGQDNATGVLQVRSPEISASGDSWRVVLRLGASAIHITALSAEARFAYFVDPDWLGEHRTVHIVATPGVRIDEAPSSEAATYPDDPRTLLANRIYVQDPRQVPPQGEPIDPSRYLGIARHDNAPAGVTPTGAGRAAFTVATGGTGVTVRDLASGAAMTIRAADPTLGARYLHDLDGKQFRALVSKDARVDIAQVRQAPQHPNEEPDPFFDFGQVDFLIYQVNRDDHFPEPGTPLTRELLERYGHRKAPDAVAWVTSSKSPDQIAIEALTDVGLSFAPGLGDMLDLLDGMSALTAGTDKWGNPLSRGEKIAVAIAALLPLVTVGAVVAAKRLASGVRAARVAHAGRSLVSLAQQVGRSESEIQALLANLRRLDDEARAAARRIEQAVSLGDHINPADLEHLERSLSKAGFHGAALTAPRVGAHAWPPTGAGRLGAAAPVRTARLADDERALQQALNKYARKLGVRGSARRARVNILDLVEFRARFGSDSAYAVFQMTERGPVIFARADAKAEHMLDEAAHLAQLADPGMAPTMRALDEGNLKDWESFSVADKLEFYQSKLDVEIEAKHRTLRLMRDDADRARAQGALDDLEKRQAEVAAITPDDLVRMNSGQLPAPEYLDQAPRLFGKQRKVKEEIPALHSRGQGTEIEPRLVSSTKGSADYSSAYSAGDVISVHQRGNTWRESTLISSDLDATIASRTVASDGVTEIVVAKGNQSRKYVLEPGAQLADGIVPGRKVMNGQPLGRESAREYRAVDVTRSDGTTIERTEIRSFADHRSWVQRGQESTARGKRAEIAAKAEADADLNVRVKNSEISSAFHVPHSVGGGGFDDVIVEFIGESDSVNAKIRIREIKDHPNRHVSLSDFSALSENFDQNYLELQQFVAIELAAADRSVKGIGPKTSMTQHQLAAVSRALAAKDFGVEIVLSRMTHIGTSGHHASRVIPELSRRFANLTVHRIGGHKL